MNARQKAKKYKRLYEMLAKQSVPMKIIYNTDLLRYECNLREHIDRYYIETKSDEDYLPMLKYHMKKKLTDEVADKLPVSFYIEGDYLVGRTEFWFDRNRVEQMNEQRNKQL